ncbi:hypothetical protein IAR55_000505 [Kwoniella newhampshirensis]|uniref:CUE domain-containing protein n=1 Tax=Kwoniella newhampshirensis TaxID=1651941 RepID=A0AAW0Z6T4_9TREE
MGLTTPSLGPGFQHAGVTKGMMALLGISSLSASLLDVKPYLHLQLVPHLTKYHQFWRIAVHPLAFANSTELLVGLILFYNVGVGIERAFGSRKYASFILVSSLLSTLIASITILLFYAFGLNSVPAGPYGIIFSLLWQQYRTVPSFYYFRLFGIEMSNKAFMWILALQLALSSPPASVLAALSGLLTGYIYRTDTLFPLPSLSISRRRLLVRRSLKTYRIPLSLHLLLARLFSPIVGTSAAPRRSNRVLPGQITETRGTATGVGIGAEGTTRPTLRSLLASRLSGSTANTTTTGAVPPPTIPARTSGSTMASPQRRSERADDAEERESGSATAAMGEWVSEMTGRSGTRAPTEEEISALSNMFPNLGRDLIVRALQRNNYNTAQAVEALLEENA